MIKSPLERGFVRWPFVTFDYEQAGAPLPHHPTTTAVS